MLVRAVADQGMMDPTARGASICNLDQKCPSNKCWQPGPDHERREAGGDNTKGPPFNGPIHYGRDKLRCWCDAVSLEARNWSKIGCPESRLGYDRMTNNKAPSPRLLLGT